MKNIVTLLSIGMLSGCSSLGNQVTDIVFIPNPNSDFRNAEKVHLELGFSDKAEFNEVQIDADGDANRFGISAASIAEQAISSISSALTEEAKRYEATYSARSVTDQFYYTKTAGQTAKFLKNPTSIKLAAFKLQRTVSQGDQHAISVCGIVLPGQDSKFFFMVPVSYNLEKTKAKLVGFDLTSPFGVDLLNPWELLTNPLSGKPLSLGPKDDDLDLTLSVSFDYLSYTDEGLATKTIEPKSLKYNAISLRPQDGIFESFARFAQPNLIDTRPLFCSSEHAETTDNMVALRDYILENFEPDSTAYMQLVAQSALFPSPPRAFLNELDISSGNANVTMKLQVTEFDNFGKRVQEVSGAFDEEKEDLQSQLTNFLSQ